MNRRRTALGTCGGGTTRLIFSSGLIAINLLVALSGCRPSARRIAENLSKSTLFVETFDAEGKPLGQGTAFFITPQTALTNMHVMKWAKTLKLSSPARGVSFDVAAVVGVNFDRDLCVLRLTSKEGRPLSFASKGSVAVGDKVYVAGNPKGLTGTVSTGIVSSFREDGRLIQIDAPISPGSSGGPVVNDRGEVLGVATMSLVAGQNLNLAVATFGGPEVRAVDWPVADVGKVSVSTREFMFLKGPVQRLSKTTFLEGVAETVVDEFNEDGMIVKRSWSGGSFMLTYFDARILTRSGNNKVLTYEEGRLWQANSHSLGVRRKYKPPMSEEVEYDAFGREREAWREWDGGSSYRVVSEYGEGGRLTGKTYFTESRPPVTYVYTYELDRLGNWTAQKSGDAITEKREIEYFPTN